MSVSNVLFVSIDSLNRHFLGAYGQPIGMDVETDALDRFAAKAATFETHYAGSLPCMPARREWLTGTQEFLWRPWGPIEPFDATLPRAARDDGVLAQLITDHYHYFQHGSSGYYEDFNAFEFVRGHEFDAWKSTPHDPDERLLAQTTSPASVDPAGTDFMNRAQYARNVDGFDETDEDDFFAPKVFGHTADWLSCDPDWEQWFCYVDSFDVHEPFHCPEPYASMYTDEDPTDPDLIHWPFYGRIDEGQSELTGRHLEFARAQFAGKVTMVDRHFGRVLDALDDADLWDDTVVIVTSDHGHYLGEHGWIGKPGAPLYNVLAHTPLFVWHPDSPRMGERLDALTSAVDLYSTTLSALGVEHDPRHGRSLLPVLEGEGEGRDWALYGYWSSGINVTDGRYTYLRPCDGETGTDCHSASMMSPHSWFTTPEPQLDAESGRFLPHTDAPVWRYSAPSFQRHEAPLLFDVGDDPWQEENIAGGAVEERMAALLVDALDDLDAPASQYARVGLT